MKKLVLNIVFLIVVCLPVSVFAQPSVLGTQAQNGGYATYNLNDLGIFRQVRMQATSSGATGTRNWEFCEGTAAAPIYDPAWRPYTCCLTIASYNNTIAPVGGTSSALKNIGFGGSSGYLPAITNGNYYTFNCTEYSTPGVPQNEFMGVLQTTYNPVAISSVVQSPGIAAVYPENSVFVTITTSAAPSIGEYVYLRYSNSINFATSTLLTVAMVGTTGTAEIPCQPVGTTIYYYVYSSNKTSAAILAEVGAFGQVAHDMNTLSINNNGGPNYIYTVLPSIGFCGNYYVPSVCYPTIASFVSALNAGVVSCAVTCNVAAGHTETAPVGGINLTKTGTAANTITFIKNGVGANPIIYAPVGTVSLTAGITKADGIFTLNGSDYITLDGIDLRDNNVAAPGTMEFGYGIFKNSGTDGCQNNIIRNCTITLKNSNYNTGPTNFENGSVGIIMRNTTRTALTTFLGVSAVSGRSDNNSFYGNTITNCYNGIVIAGYNYAISPYTYFDQNNKIGITGSGNTIQNFGNSAGNERASAIFAVYNNNLEIRDNVIDNFAGGGFHGYTLYGIFISCSNAVANYLQSITISNNSIKLSQGAVTYLTTAIKTGNANIGASNISITNNAIQNCNFDVGAMGSFYGIDNEFDVTTLQISNNNISNNTINSTSVSPIYLIYDNTNSPNTIISGNIMLNNIKTTTASGAMYGYVNNTGGSAAGSTIVISNNIIDNLAVSNLGNGYVSGIFCNFSNSAAVKTVSNNTVSNIIAGSGTTNWTSGIMVNNMPTGSSVTGNSVSNVASTSNAIGINCASFNSISTSLNQSFTISGNSVSGISSTGNSAHVCGISVYSITNVNCNFNTIDNITASGTSPLDFYGISLGGGAIANTLYINNCIIGNVHHTNAGGSSNPVGLYLFPNSAVLEIYKNHIYEISGIGNDFVVGIYGTSGTTTYNIYNNFIQRLYASASTNNTAVNGIYVAAGGSSYNAYYNTIALGQNGIISGASGFGVCGFYHGAGLLNLRNNIIYVNANASGTGVVSCVRKPTPGAAGTAPATTSIAATSNNNFYYINPASYNYVYVEGLTTGTIKNGYAYSGATTSVPFNLNNDPCFNILTASDITSYKYYMSLGGGGTRENGSFYDIPHFAGGVVLPNNLKLLPGTTDYAESHAVNIAVPLITTDYEGTIRQGNPGYLGAGTAPDIGADEAELLLATPACLLLPIDLLSFTGWYNGIENELHWATATEINSAWFDVQKSLNAIDFYSIGMVEAAGYSLAELNYVLLDDDPIEGINYYRLNMIDFDGSAEYSETIAIRVDGDGNPAFIVFPNPTNNVLNFSINVNQNQNVELVICDVLGRKMSEENILIHEGQNTFSRKIDYLEAATYFIYYFDKFGQKHVVPFIKE